jgi:hypothetical protein
MRFRIVALITALLTGVCIVLYATPALAQPSVNICTPPTSDTTGSGDNAQCWNNQGGDARDGNPIQYWENDAQGQHNNAWVGTIIGTVKDGEGGVLWPFDDGSQLNTRYNGDPVYQFQWAANENYCASQILFWDISEGYNKDGPLVLEQCASTTYQDFVYSGERFIVAAGASDELYYDTHAVNAPVWVGEENDTHSGAVVWMSPEVGQSLRFSINELV